ncbi:MAG: hypothetical protein ACFFDT_30775 [Candidatus Hodarchaeota archaeon]
MIQHLLLLLDNGVPIISRSYCDEEINEALISGFISAFDNFGKAALGEGIKQVQLGEKYLTLKHGQRIMVIIVSLRCVGAENQNDCVCVPSTLNKVIQEFQARYQLESDLVKTDLYRDFYPILDEIIEEHFYNHFYIKDFILNMVKGVFSSNLHGIVIFRSNQLIQYQLFPSTPKKIRYQKFYEIVRMWRRIVSSTPVIQNIYFDDFIIGMIYKKPWTIFSIWTKETPSSALKQLQESLLNSFLEYR